LFFSSSTPKGYSVGGLKLKLAISCSVLDELPPNRKAVSEQKRHSCSESPHSHNNSAALCRCTFCYINTYLLLGIRHSKAPPPPPPLLVKCAVLLLGGLAKLRKLTTSVVASVGQYFLLSVRHVRMEQLGSHRMDVHYILHEDKYSFFLIISCSVLLGMRNVSDNIYGGNQIAPCSIIFFSKFVPFVG